MTHALPYVASMPDILALLSKPVSGTLSPGREICADASSDGMIAILREIDGTVLRRVLVFQNSALSELHLEVTGRRLKRIVLQPDGVAPCDEVDVANADGQAALLNALNVFLASAGPVSVATRPSDSMSDAGLEGATAQTLARAFGLEPIDPDKAYGAFIEAACGLATAWLRSEGEIIAAYGGEETVVDDLAATLAETDSAPTHAPECMLVYAAGSDSDICAIARHGEEGAALRVPAAKAQEILSLWQDHFS